MTPLEGECELVALALVRLDLASRDGRPPDDEADQLLRDLLARCGDKAALALISVLVHLQANAYTVIAETTGQGVTELLDDLELQELVERAAEH